MADWKEEIGFARLQFLVGLNLPNAPVQGYSQIEAPFTSTTNYAPDTANSNFAGKTFTLKSGASEASPHATDVASALYGNSTSLLTGKVPVDVYGVSGWLSGDFLKTGSMGSAPLVESRAVQNHSWVGASSNATEASRRLDFAINRDGFVSVVGENNGSSTDLPLLMGQGYHTISVGLVNGSHSAGFTTIDITGRIKPDIVAPDGFTSFATPMVGASAGLLYSKLVAAPYSLTGADKPRVIKALLLASATQDTVSSWANSSARPLDLRYGAGELNINHAYNNLIAGRVAPGNTTLSAPRGWSAESIAGFSSNTYFFSIPSGTVPTPFTAALTWHRILLGPPFNNSTLANLNLRLYHSSGFSIGALVAESLSTVDNVELVHQADLSPGNYALVVENLSSAVSTPYALAWHSLPTVSIVATTPIARESDLQQGLITITRSGDTTLPLFVPLVIAGSAVAGDHYETLPGSVIISAGHASTVLPVIPVADNVAQGNRDVVVSIAADFALVRDPLQSATVTIQDKPFDAWRFSHFSASELLDSAISGANADPDGDQFPNLMEYALNLDPLRSSALPDFQTENSGFLAVTANKNPSATDLSWGAEVSDDLQDWTSAVTTTNTSTLFKARDIILIADAPKRMIRIRVTLP